MRATGAQVAFYRVDGTRLFYLNTYRGFIAYDLADPKNVPYYFMPGPTYAAMCEILLQYIERASRGSAGTQAGRRTATPRMTPISFGGSGPESAKVKKTATTH